MPLLITITIIVPFLSVAGVTPPYPHCLCGHTCNFISLSAFEHFAMKILLPIELLINEYMVLVLPLEVNPGILHFPKIYTTKIAT